MVAVTALGACANDTKPETMVAQVPMPDAQSATPASSASQVASALPAKPTKRIVNGERTSIAQHPWQVALQVRQAGGVGLCGGALVAAKWILTAAHCLPAGVTASDVSVKAGATDISSEGSWAKVERLVRHTGYDPATHDNDLALIKLADVGPGRKIPLAAGAEVLEPGETLEATGWGATAEGGGTVSVLQKVSLPFVPNATCNKPEAYNKAIKAGMLCAGAREGGADACQGDSGGPLVKRKANGPVLVGVVSFGDGCARKLKYGVYARVSNYADWINRIVGGEPV